MAKMNWEMAAKRGRIVHEAPRQYEWQIIKPDTAFWESWRRDKGRMIMKGYRVTKSAGKWLVYLRVERY